MIQQTKEQIERGFVILGTISIALLFFRTLRKQKYQVDGNGPSLELTAVVVSNIHH